jgi:hypothetical protein
MRECKHRMGTVGLAYSDPSAPICPNLHKYRPTKCVQPRPCRRVVSLYHAIFMLALPPTCELLQRLRKSLGSVDLECGEAVMLGRRSRRMRVTRAASSSCNGRVGTDVGGASLTHFTRYTHCVTRIYPPTPQNTESSHPLCPLRSSSLSPAPPHLRRLLHRDRLGLPSAHPRGPRSGCCARCCRRTATHEGAISIHEATHAADAGEELQGARGGMCACTHACRHL